jgi:hypothetical protein
LSELSGQSGDQFGEVLAVGDFNGDGEDDLAVGTPGHSNDRGIVYIYEGVAGPQRISSTPQSIFQSAILGSIGETGDRFGSQLLAADLNGDSIDDLVISAVGEDNGQGAVHVLFGSRSNGITNSDNRYLKQGFSGIAGTANNGDAFGTSLATGNFDGVGLSELAISAPGEDFGRFTDIGAVHIVSPDVLGTAGITSMSLVRSQNNTRTLKGGDVDGILVGNQRKNRLSAGGGGDIALGRDGVDILNGGTGDDLLDGGKDRDKYRGQKGSDTFVLRKGQGGDRILDFQDGEDLIGLAKTLAFEDLSIEKRGNNVLLSLETEKLAVIKGANVKQLSAEDFVSVDYTRFEGMKVPVVVGGFE